MRSKNWGPLSLMALPLGQERVRVGDIKLQTLSGATVFMIQRRKWSESELEYK